MSLLKGIIKKEEKERRLGLVRYRTGEGRLKKHLIEATEWSKKGGRDDKEEDEGEKLRDNKENMTAWRGRRIGKNQPPIQTTVLEVQAR